MRRILSILIVLGLCLTAQAQIITAIHWQGETVGDSVRLTATIQDGFHMTLISVNGQDIGYPEYEHQCVLSFPDTGAIAIRYNACDDQSCLAPEIFTYGSPHAPHDAPPSSLLWIFLMGLLGGLLAIFTPCVWPIIPMTVSFFLKRNDKGVASAALYGAAIVCIYVGMGLAITILFGAGALNSIATNAVVNILFFLILVVFALSFFGLFELTLPSSWSTKLDQLSREKSGVVSILLMAFTLVIVSFSCTGPIIGTLLVEAAGGGLLAPTMGMLGFALALALPFSLFALFPQWMKQMPKSGGWMQSLKVVLAFVELALSLKFLSVADLAYGWGILPRWLFLALWIGCFAGIGIYLLVNWRRVSMVRRVIRLVVMVASFGFAAYLVPGLWGAPVKAVSAFAPPAPVEAQDVFNDWETGLQFAKEQNKPILVDFTGYGCVNCRKMEAYVLDNEQVKEALKEFVMIRLYVDDKQNGIGDKNAALQRERFASNAQPYYVKLTPNGEQIGTAMAFTTSPEKFLQWIHSDF